MWTSCREPSARRESGEGRAMGCALLMRTRGGDGPAHAWPLLGGEVGCFMIDGAEAIVSSEVGGVDWEML